MKELFLIYMACLSFSAFAFDEPINSNSRIEPTLLTNSVLFDAQGKILRIVEKDGFIWLDTSQDLGKTFSNAVQINPNANRIASYIALRPRVAIGPEGNIYVAWMESLKNTFSGNILFARSVNGGKTFEKPYIVHQVRIGVTPIFEALNVNSNGNITLAWVDNHDNPYGGYTINFAVSSNSGESFSPELKLLDGCCECSHIIIVNKPNASIVAMWLNVFENGERDYEIAEIPFESNQKTFLKRITFGRGRVNSGTYHGAALINGGDGKDWWGYHMAWFDDGKDESGKDASLFYARMDGVAWVSFPPKKIGNNINQAVDPALLSLGDRVWVVWRETDNSSGTKQNVIKEIFSNDGGRSWDETKVITSNNSSKVDPPQLIANGSQGYLIWNTDNEGLKLIPL